MFAGFNIRIDKLFFDKCNKSYDDYKDIGKRHLDALKADYEDNLKSYIVDDIIDGTKVQNDWFPQINADIFISHSHIDEELAQALAGWIYDTFGLRCFIDSNVWGYAEELLEDLNTKYSNKRKNPEGGFLYDHESSNKVSQHVNVMLLVALQKMIDKTETTFLLNTDNSIEIVSEDNIDLTYSPWIYSEIICTQIVRNKSLIVYRDYMGYYQPIDEDTMEYKKNFMNLMTVSYGVSLKHLKSLSAKNILEWKARYDAAKSKQYPLDNLYEFMYPNELRKAKSAFVKVNPKDIKMIKEICFGKNQDNESIINEKSDFVLEQGEYACACDKQDCCCPFYSLGECFGWKCNRSYD